MATENEVKIPQVDLRFVDQMLTDAKTKQQALRDIANRARMDIEVLTEKAQKAEAEASLWDHAIRRLETEV